MRKAKHDEVREVDKNLIDILTVCLWHYHLHSILYFALTSTCGYLKIDAFWLGAT